MLEKLNNLPERWIIIIQPWDDCAIQIAHLIVMEKDFQPIMTIGHSSTRHDLIHVIAAHHHINDQIIHIWSSEEIWIQEAWISDVLHKLIDLQIKDTQDLILTLQLEPEDISPLQDHIRVDQRKDWWIHRKNYSNHHTSKSRQSYRTHTQKKR